MESAWQSIIPDSLLLDIFSNLDIRAIGRSAQVCTRWRRVASDELLWHNIFKKIWKIKGGLAPGKSSWHEEVRRLTDHVPTKCCETIEKHTDEVLDVSISHSGEYFCTCSKDSQVMMWKLGIVTEFVKAIDTKTLLKWELSQYSTFSPNDSLILVCGVKSFEAIPDDWERWGYGLGAVLTVPDLNVVCVAEMDPPTIFAAWLSERVFVSSLPGVQSNTISDYEISHPYVTSDSNPNLIWKRDNSTFAEICYTKNNVQLFTFHGHRNHLMNLLVANVPVLNIDSSKSFYKFHCCDTSRSGDLPMPMSCDNYAGTQKLNQHYENCFDFTDNEVKVKSSKNRIDFSEGNSNFDVSRSSDLSQTGNTSTFMSECSPMEITQNSESLCQNVQQYVIFTTGDHNVIAIHEITAEKRSKIFDVQCDDMEESNQQQHIDKLDHEFTLKDCYITGLCISHDQRYLYFNFREMDKNAPENKVDDPEDELPVAQKVFGKDLKIGCIDLVTMKRVMDIEYTGHVGFSPFPAWYICLDTCPDFIGSGSEDLRGYLWDRHYGVCVGRLFHSTLDTGNNTQYVMSLHESTVVNGIAFSPVDQETCITVCDDGLIKIWRSKNKIRTEKKKCAIGELQAKLNKLRDCLF